MYLSVLVIAEIRKGVEGLRLRDPVQAAAFEHWLEMLRVSFSLRILPITLDVAEEWGRIAARDPGAVIDGLIAATALVHDLTLAMSRGPVCGSSIRLSTDRGGH